MQLCNGRSRVLKIIFSIFAYDESTPFPSIYALVPVLGVVLLVLYADKDTLAAKLLSTKLFVSIGLISYSAYLWHQPVFSFMRHSALFELTSLHYIIAILIIISLAIDDVGKAKQSMKTTCQEIMKRYMSSGYKLPQQTYRFASPNRQLLEQLYRGGSYDAYKDELEKLADNIVYYVNITSTTSHSLEKTDTETFNMGCYKLSFDDEMIYRKWSFATKE